VRAATTRPPSKIHPIAGIPQVFDFPRDIQPILDRHCVSCHNPRQRDGGVLLTGDRGPLYSHSYFMLTIRQQFADGRNTIAANLPPYAIGAVASPLMKKLRGHHGTNLSDAEVRAIRYWIESGATYPGTYAALGSGMIGGYYKTANDGGPVNDLPEVREAAAAVAKRCASCHTKDLALPDGPCFDRQWEDPYWICGDNKAARWKEPRTLLRLRLSRHLLYNLTQPENSLLLLAPLAATKPATCPQTFRSTDDPDYQKLLAAVRKVSGELNRIKRFDMAGFRPRPEYLREMKRYGVLPATFDDRRDPADPYQLDSTYWQLFSHQPAKRY
jgi:mono/diheme cytochrome c family protein